MKIFKPHGTLNFFLLLQFISILFFTITPSDAANNIKLQLKWKHQFQFAGYYAAVEKGYYAEEGLEVTFLEGKPDRSEVEEVISGRANFGVGMSDILLSRLKGKPLVVLANIFQHSPIILLALRSSGVLAPHDLFGRKVMLSTGFKSAELKAMFINEGLSLDQIRIIKPSWNLNGLTDGKVDGIAAYISDQPYFLKLKNIPYTVISPLTYGIDFYGDNLFTSEREIKQHPKRVAAFTRASLKGWKYALDHPEEITDLILSKYNDAKRNITREFLLYEANTYQKLIVPKFVDVGHMNPGRWKHIADTYVKLGMADKDYSLNGFLYNPIPTRFNWGHWSIKLSLAVVCLGLAIIFILTFFNRRLNREIQEREKSEEDLRVSEERYRTFFEQDSDGVVVLDLETAKPIEFNDQVCRQLGYSKEEFALLRVSDIEAKETAQETQAHIRRIQSEGYDDFETLQRTKQGEIRHVHVTAQVIEIAGHPVCHCIWRDITDRKQAEEKIKSSLKEKEVLLSEIHHRVKNNMQVIISLLNLQADKIEDKKYADMLKESQNRILSMAFVHEQLYLSKNFANIDFGEYVKNFANGLFVSYGIDTNKVKLNIEIKDVSFDLENAIPCGLIINELVSNSLKHAFPQQEEGNISIALQSTNEDDLELTVSDDGVGIPEDLDIEQTDTMGLYLVKVLAEQLEGKIELNRTEGTQFHFLLKRAKYKPRI